MRLRFAFAIIGAAGSGLVALTACHGEARAPAPSNVPGPSVMASGCGAAGAWRDGPLFSIARGGHQARLLPDGMVLVWGGAENAHERTRYAAERFDLDGRREGTGYDGLPPEAIEPAPLTAPPGTPLMAALVRLADGRLLAAGGADADGAPLRTVTIDGCAAAPMRDPRADAAAVLLPDGRVLITGGRTGGPRDFDPYVRSTELFTP